MELSPGYKQTDVGVIPEDWDVQCLSSLISAGPKNGYSGRSSKDARGTPTLTLGATTSGALILNDETVKRLEETIDEKSDLFLQSGDVLVQRSNTHDLVGTTAIFDGPSGVYVYPDLMMRMRFREVATAHWFWRYANSANGRRFFARIAAGSSGSMPKISGEKLRKMHLPVPLASERHAVATAVSDVDALIGGLERFISKKRDLRKAATQQLISGQTRLPGFRAEWETRTLGESGKWLSGGTPSMANVDLWGGHIPWVSPKDMKRSRLWDAVDHVSEKAIGNGTRLAPAHSLLLVVRGMILAHSFPVARAELPLAFNQDIKALVPRDDVDSEFLLWWLTAHETLLLGITTESTHGTKRMPSDELLDVVIDLPELSEQRAIAAALSDMDAELAALEARRDKTRDLKKAMIQELLSGKTRLLCAGGAHA